MAVTLYSGFVPVCVQLLTGIKTVLQKCEAHATEQKWDMAAVVNLGLYPDMFTLERQFRQGCNHALGGGGGGGVELSGPPQPGNSVSPSPSPPPTRTRFFKGLQCI